MVPSVSIVIGFVVEYDNFPALKSRGTKRKIEYQVNSFEPLICTNVITEQDEW